MYIALLHIYYIFLRDGVSLDQLHWLKYHRARKSDHQPLSPIMSDRNPPLLWVLDIVLQWDHIWTLLFDFSFWRETLMRHISAILLLYKNKVKKFLWRCTNSFVFIINYYQLELRLYALRARNMWNLF